MAVKPPSARYRVAPAAPSCAARYRCRQRVRGRSGIQAQRRVGSAGEASAQTPLGVAAWGVLPFSSAFWVFVTGLLATWSTPVWALLITGLVAAGAAVPATLLLLRYRWLRGEPLPPQRQAGVGARRPGRWPGPR